MAYKIKIRRPGFAPRWRPFVLRRMTIDKDYMYRPSGYGGQHAKNCAEWCMTSSYLFSRFRRGIRMDENERIKLRLEKENLELIDPFLKGSTARWNRTHVVRDAVQATIPRTPAGGQPVNIPIHGYDLVRLHRLLED